MHVPIPEHPPPLQPLKLEVGSEWAVRVITAPGGNLREQFGVQAIHPGLIVTVPVPVPPFATNRAKVVMLAPFSRTGANCAPMPPAKTKSHLPSALKSPPPGVNT